MKRLDPWSDKVLLKRRANFLASGLWEEVEGCYRCFQSAKRFRTMCWPVVPARKCPKHPMFWLRKALLEKEQEGM